MGFISSLNASKISQAIGSASNELIESGMIKGSEELGERIGVALDSKAELALNGNHQALVALRRDIDRNGGAEKNRPKKVTRAEEKNETEEELVPPNQIEEQTNEFQQNHQEFNFYTNTKKDLKSVTERLKHCKTKEDVLKMVQETFVKYPPELQEKVFDLLASIAVSQNLKDIVGQAKTEFKAGGGFNVQTKSIADIAAADQPDPLPTALNALTSKEGEPNSSAETTGQLFNTHSSLAEIRKDLDQLQHNVGAQSKLEEMGAGLIVTCKQGLSTQDARGFCNQAEKAYNQSVREMERKNLPPSANLSPETMGKVMLGLIDRTRLHSGTVLEAAHTLSGG